MIFNLTMTARWVSKEDAEKYSKYGFEFESNNDKTCQSFGEMVINDSKTVTIDISDIEDLMKLVRDVGDCIISDGNIEIYNDYRE